MLTAYNDRFALDFGVVAVDAVVEMVVLDATGIFSLLQLSVTTGLSISAVFKHFSSGIEGRHQGKNTWSQVLRIILVASVDRSFVDLL